MIIIEFLKWLFWQIVRFFVWVITARDCEHCKHSYIGFWGIRCGRYQKECDECLRSIKRKYFEKERGSSND